MAKLRVLRIQSRICVGGPALNAIFLSAFLPEETYRTLLVGGRLEPGEMSMIPKAHKYGVAVHELSEMGRSIRWLDDVRAFFKLIKLMRHFKPHVVHTHTAKAGALGRLAAFICRVPLRVHTFHGHVFHGYFPSWKSRLFVLLEKFLAFLSHRIIVISQRQYADIVETYKVVKPSKARIVRLGFQLDHLTGGQPGHFRKSLGFPSETILVGIVARLVPIKNHQLFLEAIAHWTQQKHGFAEGAVQFLVIGDGEIRADLEQQCRDLQLGNWVKFVGWRSDLADIYADLQLNVLVSKNEGTPVTLIEGLACGVPILTTDVGGIRDFADRDCGTIVPADVDPQTLGHQLGLSLETARDRGRLAPKIRERICASFHVNRLVKDVDALYTEALPEEVRQSALERPMLPETLKDLQKL